MRILVRMPNWIGDAVMATAILPELSAAFPHAEITILTFEHLKELYQNNPHVSYIWGFKKPRSFFSSEYGELTKTMKLAEFDLGILCTGSLSSALLFYRGGVKRRIGYQNWFRNTLLTDPLQKEPMHQIDEYKRLLTPLGIHPSKKSLPKLYISENESSSAIFTRTPYILLNPGAAYGAAKCWPLEYFITLAKMIHKAFPEYAIVVCGSNSDRHKYEEFPKEYVHNLAGKTSIRELLVLIQNATFFITNDSGPMHIADALQVPHTAIFGSTDPAKTGPVQSGEVVREKVACAPCFQRSCPIDFRCMRRLTPELVFQRICKHLEEQCVLLKF